MRIDRTVLLRVLCAVAVAAVMLPLGNAVFPFVDSALDGTQFHVIEALISAAGGYGLYAMIG